MSWATGVEVAAEIEVAVAKNFGCREVFDDVDGGGVEEVVVVPGDFGCVHEYRNIRQRLEVFVVVVDDVGEEDHRFVTFIQGNTVLSGTIVDGVGNHTKIWVDSSVFCSPCFRFFNLYFCSGNDQCPSIYRRIL